jgi:F-type H+-transporting ATPase subunit gamma
MPTARDIKRKIKSIKNIEQITKAMKLIATTKMQKAQNAMFSARPYANSLLSLISHLIQRAKEPYHALLEKREKGKRVCFIPITSERGFCGSFNSNVIKMSLNMIKEMEKEREVFILNLGNKGNVYFKRLSYPIISFFHIKEPISYDLASEVGTLIIEKYLNREIDEIYLIYNEFKSMMIQKVTSFKLLPIELEPEIKDGLISDYLYEPDPVSLLDKLIKRYLCTQIYKALLESFAAEQSARMIAMDNATKNASEMISQLQLNYNRIRQATITKEISEIVGGREVLSA